MVTIGNHIRKRRLALGLTKLVRERIGVTDSTVWNWDHGVEPELRFMPAVIKFLGYVPFKYPNDPVGKLWYFKQVNGLSYEKLGALMERDPEQLTDWLSGRMRPRGRNLPLSGVSILDDTRFFITMINLDSYV